MMPLLLISLVLVVCMQTARYIRLFDVPYVSPSVD